MEIVCTRTLKAHLISRSFLLVIPLLMLPKLEKDDIAVAVLGFICVTIIAGSGRLVRKLRIQGDQLEIDYVKFFRCRTKCFKITDTVLMIKRYTELRSGGKLPTGPIYEYDWLHVIVKGKEKFYVDGRKGFSTEQFMQLLQAFADARAKL